MQPGIYPPAAVYNNIVNAGTAKAGLPFGKTFFMGLLAGAYISLGAFLAVTVGGNIPGEHIEV